MVIDLDSIQDLFNPEPLIIIEACRCDTVSLVTVGSIYSQYFFAWLEHEEEEIETDPILGGLTEDWYGNVILFDGDSMNFELILPVVLDFDDCMR